ncbi:hypothetical protein Q5O14_08900 [Eubacteriaceae bacterium ES2]|nr:hypothetical protein Q5O14_08900 [Eubacteriaceae bacterium ES2]
MSRTLIMRWMGYLILAMALLLLPFLIWSHIDAKKLNVWIVDQSESDRNNQNLDGLTWIINSQKIISDQKGTFTGEQNDNFMENLITGEGQPDILYLASDSANNPIGQSQGLTNEQVEGLKNYLVDEATIIGQYDIFNAQNRKNLEEIFRVSNIGWKGCYFQELKKGEEVSDLIVENYQKQTGQEWNFVGSGLILVSDLDQILVLRDGAELASKGVQINFAGNNSSGLKGTFSYEKWFDLTIADASSEVLATFDLDVSASGQKLLEDAGLQTQYAAISCTRNSNYTAYYFSGDYANMDFSGKLWNYYGFAQIKYLLSKINPNAETRFYWGAYVPLIEQILSAAETEKAIVVPETANAEIQMNARTSATNFQVFKDSVWQDFFIKGVNLGSSVPGKWFTEFTYDEDLYLNWFEQIANMNANTLRVYTLMPPQFYSALVYFNEHHPNQTLWLCQEIWPEENPEDHDYLKEDYNTNYQSEIKMDLDAIHGQANIPERSGRAYGYYTADVSPYIIGYLVGRELEPEEVISTNTLHAGQQFSGTYLYTTADASPTEAWLAMSCDFVAEYEETTYKWQHPVGIVSWPTLDPAEHDSEWNETGDKSLQYNDKVSVDINHIAMQENLQAGFFGGYHIYPNYPDFMNNEESYAQYSDEYGSFRYGGYLKEFIAGHSKYPAVVAEFGMATGMGTAHANPDGLNHGGVTETEQGEDIVRMMEAIDREGYAGGIIFEWSDEWAKKTWITEPYMIPYHRQALWHNSLDPEQNYGILAMESSLLKSQPYSLDGDGNIQSLVLSADESYLYLKLELNKNIDYSKDKLVIGLDTVDRSLGDLKFSSDIGQVTASGMEFVIAINSKEDAKLLVQPAYNFTTGHYLPLAAKSGDFEMMSILINKETTLKSGQIIAPVYEDFSSLSVGDLADNSANQIAFDNQSIAIRIPWTLLNVSDPSSQQVLYDANINLYPAADEIQTSTTEGILVYGIIVDRESGETLSSVGLDNQSAFIWQDWDIPDYQERQKSSYQIIQDYFSDLENEDTE